MSSIDQLCDDQTQTPISKQENTSSSPFHFPSPFFDELPLNQILPHHYHHHPMAEKNPDHSSETAPKCSANGVSKLKGKARDQSMISAGSRRRNMGVMPPKKRTGKKDRHSKIRTAQGIRDRRMRLSLQAARKFFDLQDMLGYDKASKTIEWLFSKSKKAIKELMINKDNHPNTIIGQCEEVKNFSNKNEVEKLGIIVPIGAKKSEKLSVCKSNTRESRDKARARARCRTREKMMIKLGLEDLSQLCYKVSSPNDVLEKLGSCSNSPLFDQERVVSAYGSDEYPSLLVSPKLADDVGTIEKLLENSNSSTTLSCDPDSNFMGFFGNWDLLMNNERLNSSNELYAVTTEVQFGGSPNSVYSAATTPDFPLFHQ